MMFKTYFVQTRKHGTIVLHAWIWRKQFVKIVRMCFCCSWLWFWNRKLLSFVENNVSDPFVNDFEQSDEDLCAIVSEAEESDNDDDSAVVSEGTKTDKFVDDPFHSMC